MIRKLLAADQENNRSYQDLMEETSYKTKAGNASAAEDECFFVYAEDQAYYPPETMDDFSIDPIEFEEAAGTLTDDMNILFNMTASYNRRSPQFLNTSGKLLEILKDLAVCCITKAALEKKGIKLTGLEMLSTADIYRMASFNFRKCHAAFTELSRKWETVSCQSILDLERRWFNMLERMRSTEEKIEAIRSGSVSADRMLKLSKYFAAPRKVPHGNVINHKPLGQKPAPSFPILRATAAERANRFNSGTFSRAKPFTTPQPFPPADPFPQKTKPPIPDNIIRGKNTEAESKISDDEMENLRRIWERYTGKKAPSGSGETGPGSEAAVHKNLLAKKKKKKKA